MKILLRMKKNHFLGIRFKPVIFSRYIFNAKNIRFLALRWIFMEKNVAKRIIIFVVL